MQLHEKIILKLAEIFYYKSTEATIKKEALSLVCESFNFDCGFFYETDHSNFLNLLEYYGAEKMLVQKEILLKSISDETYQYLAKNHIVHCGSGACPKIEEQILNILDVKSAVIVSITDGEGCIYGIIALCNIKEIRTISTEEQENLEMILTMVSAHFALKMYQKRANYSQSAMETIFDNTGIDIYVNDFYTHDILYVNKSMASPYGGQEAFKNRKCWQVLFPGQTGPCEFCPQKQLIDDEGNPTKVYTWDYQRAFDGAWFRVFSSAFKWSDGRIAHVVSSADISDNKKNEELIEYMANYDELTKLPNRRMLISELEKITQKNTGTAYLLFFDIDGFKKINDTLGHDAGDEFLIKLGELFTTIPMTRNSAYRNGGDEFVVLLTGDITEENVKYLARFINIRFEKPWDLANGSINCGVSIGVSVYPKDGKTSSELLQKADQAMYKAKNAGGRRICFFSAENK